MYSSDKTLLYLINVLTSYLDELTYDCDIDDNDMFCYGEKTAYVECLEIIQRWEKSKEHGLDFNIEDRYPL